MNTAAMCNQWLPHQPKMFFSNSSQEEVEDLFGEIESTENEFAVFNVKPHSIEQHQEADPLKG